MAIRTYISATSTTPPIPQDPSRSPLPTKIILPNKKPEKWSTGVAPGEYGGPPTTTKLRKYWGGEKEDPITSKDLIWNRDFMDQMKKLFDSPDDDTLLDPSPSKVIFIFFSKSLFFFRKLVPKVTFLIVLRD